MLDKTVITTLYLGLEKPEDTLDKIFIHYPVIQIIPKKKEECPSLNNFLNYTHLVFTSKTSVKIFFDNISASTHLKEQFKKKIWVVVGRATKKYLETYGIENVLTPKNETAEGIVTLLKTMPLKNSSFFWPRSAIARPILRDFFLSEDLLFEECILYDTVPFWPGFLPNFDIIDEIIFTSPSTVDAFFQFFPNFKLNKIFSPIGPITKSKLFIYIK